MGLKFIGTSVILERKHDLYKGSKRVKAHFFQSPNGENIVIKTFNDEFHKLSKAKSIVMTSKKFSNLPDEAEAKADRLLKMMGWE